MDSLLGVDVEKLISHWANTKRVPDQVKGAISSVTREGLWRFLGRIPDSERGLKNRIYEIWFYEQPDAVSADFPTSPK